MTWTVIIDEQRQSGPSKRYTTEVATPHLHVAIDSALFRAKLDGAKAGSFQITAESKCA